MHRIAVLSLALTTGCVGVVSVETTGEIAPDAGEGQVDQADADVEQPPGPDAAPEDGTAFLLPWTGGTSFRVTQGHNTGSHVDKGSFAWDFGLPVGTPLRASHDGIVRVARGDSTIGGCNSSYANDANYVVIDRGDGLESLYLHLTSTSVTEGQRVTRGTIIGTSGQTGWACGAHLHFQIQNSPESGGTSSWYNTSVSEGFHDTGSYYDPPYPSEPISANSQ